MSIISQSMLDAGLPEGFVLLCEELSEESEGFNDVFQLWYEAKDGIERLECEIDMFAMTLDRLPEDWRRTRVNDLISDTEKHGLQVASDLRQVPMSVLSYLRSNSVNAREAREARFEELTQEQKDENLLVNLGIVR